jgi:hypothetical protein
MVQLKISGISLYGRGFGNDVNFAALSEAKRTKDKTKDKSKRYIFHKFELKE